MLRTRRIVRRMVTRSVGALALGMTLFGMYLYLHGIPPWAAKRILQRVSSPRYSLEARRIRPAGVFSLEADDVRLYAKRRVGPALLTARTASFSVNPFSLRSGRRREARITLCGGAVGEPLLAGRDGAVELGQETPADRRAQIDLRVIDMRISGVEVERLKGTLDVDGRSWELSGVRSVLSRAGSVGTWTGAARYDHRSREVRGHLNTDLDAQIVLPLLRRWGLSFPVALIQRFEFGSEPPRCEARFVRQCAPPHRFESTATVSMLNAAYRGVNLLEANADLFIGVESGHVTVRLDPLRVVRPEGAAKVKLTYDGADRAVLFDGQSTLDHKPLTRMIGILTNGVLDEIQCDAPFNARGTGRFALRDREDTDVIVRVESGALRRKKIRAKNVSFTLRSKGMTHWIEEIRGDVYGGRLSGNVRFSRTPRNAADWICTGQLTLKDVDGSNLGFMQEGPPADRMRGNLSGRVTFSGVPGSRFVETMTGHGELDIRDGRVFSLPLFGGFSRIMRKVIPGLDFVLRQGDAEAAFTIAEGRVSSDEIHVKGDVLSLSGHGAVGIDGELDFLVRVRLMKEHTFVAKLISPLMYPISKLFELRLHGTLKDPTWYPVNFSRDMLRAIGLVDDDEIRD